MTSQAGYKWLLLALLFFCAVLNYADRTAVSAVFPLLREEFGMSDVALASLGSFFLWTYGAMSPFAGLLADRMPRGLLITLSLAAWSFSTFAAAFVSSSAQLLGTRVLLGLSECFYIPAAIALLAEFHPLKTRAIAMAVHSAGLTIGMVAGATFGGYLGENYGWRTVFHVLGVASLTLACAAFFVLPRKPGTLRHAPAPAASLRAVIGNAAFLFLVSQAMVIAAGVWMLLNWLPLYYKETFNMSLAGAGFSGTFLLNAGATVGVLLGGVLSDLLARRNPRHRAILVPFCYLLAAPLVLTFYLSSSFIWIGAFTFLFSVLRSTGSVNDNPILCDLLKPELRGTAVGLLNFANCLAGGVGIFVTGYWKESVGLGRLFGGISLTLVAAGLLAFGVYWRYGPGRKGPTERLPIVPSSS